jgi:hypothetical protein
MWPQSLAISCILLGVCCHSETLDDCIHAKRNPPEAARFRGIILLFSTLFFLTPLQRRVNFGRFPLVSVTRERFELVRERLEDQWQLPNARGNPGNG